VTKWFDAFSRTVNFLTMELYLDKSDWKRFHTVIDRTTIVSRARFFVQNDPATLIVPHLRAKTSQTLRVTALTDTATAGKSMLEENL
jgi:hypothetical protein